jgi:hypothetical protein
MTRQLKAPLLVRVLPVLPPTGNGSMWSHEAWMASKLYGASTQAYVGQGHWQVKCWHEACPDPKGGHFISEDVTRELAMAEAREHRAHHGLADDESPLIDRQSIP